MREKSLSEPCACGNHFCDYDNRCLRCKKAIEAKRAQNLAFHRKVSEIPICKCPEITLESWGRRITSIEELELCNFCDGRFGVEVQDIEDTAAKELAAQKEEQAQRL